MQRLLIACAFLAVALPALTALSVGQGWNIGQPDRPVPRVEQFATADLWAVAMITFPLLVFQTGLVLAYRRAIVWYQGRTRPLARH